MLTNFFKLIKFILLIPLDIYKVYQLFNKIKESSLFPYLIYSSASRIGNLAYQPDNFLMNYENNKAIIFLFTRRTANNFLLKLLSENSRIFFLKLNSPFSYYFLKNKLFRNYQISFKDLHLTERAPISRFYPCFFPLVSKNLSDKKMIFDKLNIKKEEYIVIHNRDSSYLTSKIDSNFHDYRNYDINSTKKGLINQLSGSSKVVRITRRKEDNFFIDNKNFLDLTEDKGSEKLDIFLIESCKYFIGCNSGILWICRLFRKPCLIINTIPFSFRELTCYPSNSIFLPKLLYSEKLGRILSFKEMIDISVDLSISIHSKSDYYKSIGLKVLDNSEDEISHAINEMNHFVDDLNNKNKKPSKENEYQILFHNKFKNFEYFKDLMESNINLSTYFIKKYNNILFN